MGRVILGAAEIREARHLEVVQDYLMRSRERSRLRQALEDAAEASHQWVPGSRTCVVCGVSDKEVVLRKHTEDMRCPVLAPPSMRRLEKP
jgi:hypothetical protein